MADGARGYSDEEVEAIFRRALERQQAAGEGFGRDELVAAAREMGLDEAALDHAAREVERERGEEALRQQLRERKRDRWLRHLVTYLVVAGGLVGMNLLGFAGAWVIWIAFFWGAALALHTFDAIRGPSETEVERAVRRQNRARRRAARAQARQARRRERREAQRRRQAERRNRTSRKREVNDELERVVEEGVTLLLGMAAKKLERATEELERGGRPKGAFGEYVARQQARGRGETAPGEAPRPVRERPDPVRVRVAEDEAPALEEAESETRRRRRRAGG